MFTGAADLIDIVIIVTRDYGLQTGVAVAAYLFAHKRYNIGSIFDNKGGRSETKICETIDSALQSILFKLGADRAFLFEFRGYDKEIWPIPFAYTDNTVEIINPSATIKAEKETLQDIPLSTIPFWVQELSSKRQVCISDIESIRLKDPTTFQILQRQSIQSVYAVMLVDFCSCPMGFVGVDYCQVVTDLRDCQMDRLRAESLKVAGLLVLKKKFKDK